MIWAISYGDEKYRKSRDFNLMSATKFGKADKVIAYGPEDIDEEFKSHNYNILKEKRGNGYWLWKPYIILKTFDLMPDGDYLIYCDAGAFYKNKIQSLIDSMNAEKQNIMCFDSGGCERTWTKRDAFILMDCDSDEYSTVSQRCATYILFRKCDESVAVVKEWLRYSEDRRIISDDKNVLGYPDYPEFSENRHDQSVWSLLTKKYGIPAFRDPSQYGNKINNESDVTVRSNYKQVFLLHRKGDIDSYFKLWRHMFFLNHMYNGGKLEFLYTGVGKLYKLYAKLKKKFKGQK